MQHANTWRHSPSPSVQSTASYHDPLMINYPTRWMANCRDPLMVNYPARWMASYHDPLMINYPTRWMANYRDPLTASYHDPLTVNYPTRWMANCRDPLTASYHDPLTTRNHSLSESLALRSTSELKSKASFLSFCRAFMLEGLLLDF